MNIRSIMKRGMKLNSRGQVTIFIIIAIIIVVGGALFFMFKEGIIPQIGGGLEKDPAIFLQTCMDEPVQDILNTLENQGGFMENELYKKFKFTEEDDYTNIPLLCYTKDYYVPCINQHPMYISEVNQEVKEAVAPIIEDCFDSLTQSLQKQNDAVEVTPNGFEVEFQEDRIIFNIDSKIVLTNAGETTTQEDFKIGHPTMFYNLLKVVQEITSQEAEYCYFENIGYMAFHPEYDIRKFRTGDSILIYRVKDERTEEQFKFAVRGCIRPAGL
jgi:hypothetical protein